MSEIWKAVPGYEGLYEVSNMGRVRSLDTIVVTKRGVQKKKKGLLLQPMKTKKGYYMVNLQKTRMYVHRIVAAAFLPNPDLLPYINHKDENKENNRVDNLEWCDNKYNLNYGTTLERMRAHSAGFPKKRVVQMDREGNELGEFESLADAARAVGVPYTNIAVCCKETYRTAGGYKWKFKT